MKFGHCLNSWQKRGGGGGELRLKGGCGSLSSVTGTLTWPFGSAFISYCREMILFAKNKIQILQLKLWALMQRLELFKNLGILLFFHGYKIFDDTEHFDIMISLQNFQFFENVRSAITLALHESTKLVLKIFHGFNQIQHRQSTKIIAIVF